MHGSASLKHLEKHSETTSTNLWHGKGPREKLEILSDFFQQGCKTLDIDQNLEFKQPGWKLDNHIASTIPE